MRTGAFAVRGRTTVTESLPGIVLKHNEHPEGFRVLVAFRNTPN